MRLVRHFGRETLYRISHDLLVDYYIYFMLISRFIEITEK